MKLKVILNSLAAVIAIASFAGCGASEEPAESQPEISQETRDRLQPSATPGADAGSNAGAGQQGAPPPPPPGN